MVKGRTYRVKTLEELKACGTVGYDGNIRSTKGAIFNVNRMSPYCGEQFVAIDKRHHIDNWVFDKWMVVECGTEKIRLLSAIKNFV